MKNLLFVLALMFGLLSNKAFSQSENLLDSIVLKEGLSLKQELTLTDTQTSAVMNAIRDHRQVSDSIRNLSITASLKTHELRIEESRFRNNMHSILSEEQFNAYVTLINQRKEAFRNSAREKNIKINELEQ